MESDTDITTDELQRDVSLIKQAMGIHERYPYMAKIWLTEGVLVGVAAIGMQLGVRGEIPSYWIWILLLGLIVVEQVIFRRIIRTTEQPATGSKPGVNVLVGAMVLGMFALVIGLDPLIAHSSVDETVLSAVLLTALAGVLYVAVGNTLIAYSIRKRDRYAIYIGGLWLFVLAAAISHVPFLQYWAYAALGVSVIVHGVGSYLVLQRV